ncbi:2Fe-2S iron-sulfur cluster-binding protein [Pseudaeromonas pectinilytica]
MDNLIELHPSGVTFYAEGEQSLLQAAQKNNIVLEHSCGTGQCGACKAKVLAGEVEFVDTYSVLTEDEKAENIVLTCTSRAKTSVELDAEYYPELASIVKKTLPCKIADMQFPTADVAILRLRVPPTASFNYLPGQYLDLTASGITRSYSIASAAVENNQLELHIRKVVGGQFSEMVFGSFKPEQLLRLHGPHGSFFIRSGDRPLIFLAGGTGFAPVKAMVESLIANHDARPIHIYWGQRTVESIYSELPAQWARDYPHIQAHVVVSDDETWSGRQGFVHQAVVADFPDMSGVEVYACGSAAMISVAKNAFIQQGLEEKAFHSDAFLPAVTQRG